MHRIRFEGPRWVATAATGRAFRTSGTVHGIQPRCSESVFRASSVQSAFHQAVEAPTCAAVLALSTLATASMAAETPDAALQSRFLGARPQEGRSTSVLRHRVASPTPWLASPCWVVWTAMGSAECLQNRFSGPPLPPDRLAVPWGRHAAGSISLPTHWQTQLAPGTDPPKTAKPPHLDFWPPKNRVRACDPPDRPVFAAPAAPRPGQNGRQTGGLTAFVQYPSKSGGHGCCFQHQKVGDGVRAAKWNKFGDKSRTSPSLSTGAWPQRQLLVRTQTHSRRSAHRLDVRPSH